MKSMCEDLDRSRMMLQGSLARSRQVLREFVRKQKQITEVLNRQALDR